MMIELRELSLKDGKDILEMIREIGPGENGFSNKGYDMKDYEFNDFIIRNINVSRSINLEPNLVPQTVYWLMADGFPVGLGKVRDYLNENLMKTGGHIGYCIRPSARGKGFGNIILRELIKKAGQKGVKYALLTCIEANRASRRVIENNGGVLERIENGECYYWIETGVT